VDEKIYNEIANDINKLKGLHEQLKVLHQQKSDKIKQTRSDESLTETERLGKIHEFTSLYAKAFDTLQEEFPKKAEILEGKIAVHFDAAYFKEVDIDQKIIELESKMSPYTIHDQTAAILGLTREIRKNNLSKELTEGDYTDLLNIYRIALRTNNRTDLAYIESRFERLTRKAGKNSKDKASKNMFIELVRKCIAQRVDPKAFELKDRFDAIMKEYDQLVEEIDEELEKQK